MAGDPRQHPRPTIAPEAGGRTGLVVAVVRVNCKDISKIDCSLSQKRDVILLVYTGSEVLIIKQELCLFSVL